MSPLAHPSRPSLLHLSLFLSSSSSSFTHLFLLSSPPPPPSHLFRPSSALCESVSCWAQTPAPHFLPWSPKLHRSGKHTKLYIFCTYGSLCLCINIHTALRDSSWGVCYQTRLVSRDRICVTVLPCLLGCRLSLRSICVQGVFTELHLHAFIIPDASSHPASAEFILNSLELTKTIKTDRKNRKRGFSFQCPATKNTSYSTWVCYSQEG